MGRITVNLSIIIMHDNDLLHQDWDLIADVMFISYVAMLKSFSSFLGCYVMLLLFGCFLCINYNHKMNQPSSNNNEKA